MPKSLVESARVQRKVIAVVPVGSVPTDVAYWRGQSPRARLAAVELMREINYGKAATSARLKRVFEVAQRSEG